MKAKVVRGAGFRGALDYALDEGVGATQKKNPEIVGGNMSGRTARALAQEFGAVRRLRPDISRPVWHCALALPEGERLASDQWREVVQDFMRRMGFSDAVPYVAARHQDTDHDHVHIVASRIGIDGEVWLGQWEARRAIEVTQALEQVHGLVLTPGLGDVRAERRKPKKNEVEMAIRKGEQPPRMRLQSAIDAALQGMPTAVQFAQRLTDAGVTVRANVASTGRMNGFSFELGGIAFKGSDLGKTYTWQGLQSRGVSYEQIGDAEGLARWRVGGKGPDSGGTVELGRPIGTGHGQPDGRDPPDHGPGAEGGRPDRADHPQGRGGYAAPGILGSAAVGAGDPRGTDLADVSDRRHPRNDIGGLRDAVSRVADLAAPASSEPVSPGAAGPASANEDRTTKAVRRQIAAMGCDRYEVGIRDSMVGKMMIRTWSPDELIKSIPWLRRMNARRNDIYIRPAPDVKAGIVLVDDVEYADIERMRADGYEPIAVVETSPKNYQAWIRLGIDLPRDIRTEAARFFVKTYGSDPNSADWRHFGRLAGFTNRKPEHASLTGQPWCLLEHAKDLVPGFIAPASKNVLDAVNNILAEQEKQKVDKEKVLSRTEALQEARNSVPDPAMGYSYVAAWYKKAVKNFGSPSEADWALSIMALKKGHDYYAVRRLVSEFSPGISDRKIGHIDDYVDRTVGKAEIWVEVKRRNPDIAYDKIKDSLLFLAKERARERAVQASKELGERSERLEF